jgi:DNA-binding NtrC family response regulator
LFSTHNPEDEMPKLLFVDDEPSNVNWAIDVLKLSIPELFIDLTETVEDTLLLLSDNDYDLVVMDIFIPMGSTAIQTLGPRVRKYQENMRHLGGLAILDYIEKMKNKPRVLAHTACTDFALIEILGDLVYDRIPKPTSVDILVNEIRNALD